MIKLGRKSKLILAAASALILMAACQQKGAERKSPNTRALRPDRFLKSPRINAHNDAEFA